MFKKVVVIVTCLLSFGFGSVCLADSLAERLASKVDFLQSANEVGKKIKDDEVRSLMNFLNKNAVLAAPHQDGLRFLENAEKQDSFMIVPVLESDKGISPYWDSIFLAENAAANFLPEIRAIVLKNSAAYSSVGKAIMLLHEGYHAYLFSQNPYEGRQSDQDYCYEEVKVHTFQNKVMTLLGGKLYQKILADEVSRISKNAKITQDGFKLAGRTEYDERLALALGKPISEKEQDFIQSGVWINAVFVFFDKNYKEDAIDKKALFLRMLYKESGIL
ncbi:MAG: hypothetical protein WCF93_04975 [Candidatus Moraniibacteriota bacterium]